MGAVLYEMATGQRPFRGDTALRLADQIVHTLTPPPRRLNPALSPRLEDIILKCLEKEPENRYQSAAEAVVDLRRLGTAVSSAAARVEAPRRLSWPLVVTAGTAVVVLVTLPVALNVGRWRERLRSGTTAPRIESLAVLPLANLSGDPAQDYSADGMTEALITDLAQIGISTLAGQLFYYGREHDLAIEQLRKALELDPNVPRMHLLFGMVYKAKGMYREATVAYQKVVALSGGSAEDAAAVGRAYAAAGISGVHLWRLERLERASRQGTVGPSFSPIVRPSVLAQTYAQLGRRQQAFEGLEKAYRERDSGMLPLKGSPVWGSLRSDPRFPDLPRRMNLPDSCGSN